MAEMWNGQSRQEFRRIPVVLGLQGVSEQDLFYEKLLEHMDKWIRQPANEQHIGPRGLWTAQKAMAQLHTIQVRASSMPVTQHTQIARYQTMSDHSN